MTKLLATVSLLAAVTASAARADQKNFMERCSPGAIKACASLQIVTVLNGSGGTNVIFRVRNLSGTGFFADNTGGSIITRLGIVVPVVNGTNNGPLAVSMVGGATQFAGVGGPGGKWFLRDPGGLGGIIELTAGIQPGTHGGGIVGCTAPFGGFPTAAAGGYFSTCTSTSWIEFAFSTSNAWSANNAEIAWLYEATANGNQGNECGSAFSGNVRPWCQQVTPEPITMVLLGSGLASMGGFGFFRRRRQRDDIQNG